MHVCACVQSCLTLWDPMNPTSPSKSRSDLPHWYPIIALHLNTSLVSLRVLATTIFIYSLHKHLHLRRLFFICPPHPCQTHSQLFLLWASSNFQILWDLLLSASWRNQQELRAGEEKEIAVFLPHSLLALVSCLWSVAGSLHNDGSYEAAPPPSFQFFFFFNFTYLFIWLLQVLVEACRIFPCSTQALHCGSLAPECQGLNLHPPVLESRCLTTGPPGKSLHDSNS